MFNCTTVHPAMCTVCVVWKSFDSVGYAQHQPMTACITSYNLSWTLAAYGYVNCRPALCVCVCARVCVCVCVCVHARAHMQVSYCDVKCQKMSWEQGSHKKMCKLYRKQQLSANEGQNGATPKANTNNT